MKFKLLFCFAFLFFPSFILMAQEGEPLAKSSSDVGNFSNSAEKQKVQENQKNALLAEKENSNIIYKGEHHLLIGVGLDVPLFMHFYNDKTVGKKGNGVVRSADSYNPPVGLNGFFNYQFFLDHGFAIGAILGGTYISTAQNNQTLIHLGLNLTYMIRRWPIDIPISFEIGGHFNSLQLPYPANSVRSGGIFFKPQIGMVYNINENWGVGFSTEYAIAPEIFLNEYKDQSNFAHWWGFTVNIRYRIN